MEMKTSVIKDILIHYLYDDKMAYSKILNL